MKKLMLIFSMITACGFLLFATTVSAQSKPNFSGDWKLNVEKSDHLDGNAQAEPYVQKIKHQEPNIHITFLVKGTVTGEFSFTTDGKETANKAAANEEMDSGIDTGAWDGNTLVRTMKAKLKNGLSVTERNRMSLSDDGKTLIIQRHYSTELSEGDLKFVFDRQ